MELRRWIDRLESRLDVPVRRLTYPFLLEVRDQSAMLFEQAFGADNPLTVEMRRLDQTDRVDGIVLNGAWWRRSKRNFRSNIRRILRNARFSLDLDRAALADEPAAEPAPGATDRLVAMVRGVIVEVRAAHLTDGDREQLLAALETALDILEHATDADMARADLQSVLGHAVAKAGRAGEAAPLWKRVAEVIFLAEATVSLGLGVAAIAQPDAARIEVECRFEVPALPAPAHADPPTTPEATHDLPATD